MKKYCAAFIALLALVPSISNARQSGVVVDYNNPRKYIVGGVTVEGNISDRSR